ncbi:plasmid stabilization protein [Thermus sp. LT1-2-5]|uniref:FitA-like ribbon-helix-helix domain-containing protein n=1 Tax=Thermus sp. LT1-2-5 TaxID=3026935 RepID=UPI0033659A9E
MATLTIRNLDEATKRALRLRAALHGVSMEEEARRILRAVLLGTPFPQGLGTHLRQRFQGVADETFQVPPRRRPRKPPQLA